MGVPGHEGLSVNLVSQKQGRAEDLGIGVALTFFDISAKPKFLNATPNFRPFDVVLGEI